MKTLLGTLNKHAPLHENKCKITHRQPWFNDRIKQELVLRRRLEYTGGLMTKQNITFRLSITKGNTYQIL